MVIPWRMQMFDGMKRRIIQIKFVNLPHLTKYQKN